MADKLKQFLSVEAIPNWYDLWETPFVFLGVDSCNADECHTFSQDISLKLNIKSELDPLFNYYKGTAMCEIYNESIMKVLVTANGNYSEIDDVQQRKAVETLLNFMKNMEEGGNHFKCISLLKSKPKITEAQIQAVLACHLFSPLLTEGKVIVDNFYKTPESSTSNPETPESSKNTTCSSTSNVECPFCKDPLIEENTNFGIQDLWNGRADIVIKTKNSHMQEVVTVTVDDEGGGDEPVTKKLRLTYDEWFCLDEVKTVLDGALTQFIDEKIYKQAISQTLLNAFLAVKKNKKLKNTLIPSFLVCQNSVFINFYNVAQDILLVQGKPSKFFEGTVNYYAFFSVWMALNFQFFPSEKSTQFYSIPEISGFKSCLEKAGVLARYENEIEDYVDFSRRPNDAQFIRIVVPYKKRDEILSHLQTAVC